MNMFSYIDDYGNYTFEEMEFNEVDNIIFSALAYVSLGNYVSGNSFNKKTIKEVAYSYFENYDKRTKRIMSVRNGIKVLRYIKDTRRYGDLLLYNYVYVGNNNGQFGGMTIEINKNLVYVSFEGTDALISGWKDDFIMSYMFPIKSHKMAMNYLNRYFSWNNKKIILGGHSKGGNMAIVAGMGANLLVRKRIISIYNNDGPGLRIEQIRSKNYKRISKKIKHIVPNYSFFGLLFNHTGRCIVIKSMKKNLMAHSMETWVIDDKKLKRDKLSSFSYKLNKAMKKWINQYDDSVRERFVNSLFVIFDDLNIKSTEEIIVNKKLIMKMIKEYNTVDKEVRYMMRNFIYVVIKYFIDSKNEESKGLLEVYGEN